MFEPIYSPSRGPIVEGAWQTWDAYQGGNAMWWSTRPMGSCLDTVCFGTWNQILANYPGATIVGGFGVNQGSGNGGLIASTDALEISHGDVCATYDFEPFRSTNECKKASSDTNGGTARGRPAVLLLIAPLLPPGDVPIGWLFVTR